MGFNCAFHKLWSTITSSFDNILNKIDTENFLILFIIILSSALSTAYIRELSPSDISCLRCHQSTHPPFISLQPIHSIFTLTHLFLIHYTPFSNPPSTLEMGSFTKVYMSPTFPESSGLDSIGSVAANFARTDEEEKRIEFIRFSCGSAHVSQALFLAPFINVLTIHLGGSDTRYARHSRARKLFGGDEAQERGRSEAANRTAGSPEGSLCCLQKGIPPPNGPIR